MTSILVLGATGYVGGRLVPELLRADHTVRCLSRSAESFDGVDWADRIEIVEGDLFDPATLGPAFADIDQVVYLVHSLNDEDFERKELECAANTRAAAEHAGVGHLVYLSGLGDDTTELSPHLRSRHNVGRELASGATPVTELRAAVVIGAGSASFEMLRSLTDVIPVMTAPSWVTSTMLQPIAIADVLTYVSAAIDTHEVVLDCENSHRIVEIGGPDAMTYGDLVHVYSSVCGLRRRIIPIPVVSPGFSAHWVNLVTPIPKRLADSLIDSLEHDVVVTDTSARQLSPHHPMTTRRAVELAVAVVGDAVIAPDAAVDLDHRDPARPRDWDQAWAGGTLYEDRRTMTTTAPPTAIQQTVRGIGGERGWYGWGVLWTIRGLLDQLFGGVGLHRGRLHPDDIAPGDHIDFWRVDVVDDHLFRLRGEMKLPGTAWLEWATTERGTGTEVVQRARYAPRGLLGRLYWFTMSPFHSVIFPLMLRRIVAAAEQVEPPSPTD
ncbi:MAG: SDR family oxidoreductase [Ilumatobacteraceae bacterium]